MDYTVQCDCGDLSGATINNIRELGYTDVPDGTFTCSCCYNQMMSMEMYHAEY